MIGKTLVFRYLVFLLPIFSALAGRPSIVISELLDATLKNNAYAQSQRIADDPVKLLRAFEWSFGTSKGLLFLARRKSGGGECRIISVQDKKLQSIASSKSWHECQWAPLKPSVIYDREEIFLRFETLEDISGDGISMEKSYQQIVFNTHAKKFCRYNEGITIEDEIALAKSKSYCYSY